MALAAFKSREPAVEQRGTDIWGVWPGDYSGPGSYPVTEQTALQLLAVSGCVRLIADSISTLPVDVFRQRGDERVEVDVPMWVKEPTVDLDFTSWCTQVLTSLLLHGNAYCVVMRSGLNIVGVEPVDPGAVQVRREQGRKRFYVAGREFPGEMLHLAGIMLPGALTGLSPLEYARQSIGLGLEAQRYGQDAFNSDLNMPGVIEDPGSPDPTKIAETARHWKRMRTKANRGLPGYLTGGAVWKPAGVTNEQAQFLETRQWTAAEIAAQVYLVDPRELGIPLSGSTLNYTNAETRKADLLQKALLPWMVRIEKAITDLLPRPQFMKFNESAFLRADSGARWTQYGQAMQINAQAAALGQPPVLKTSEMRQFENLEPITEVDTPPAPQVVEVEPEPVEDDGERTQIPPVQVHIDNHPPEVRYETGGGSQLSLHLPESQTFHDAIEERVQQLVDLTEQIHSEAESTNDRLESVVRALLPEMVRASIQELIPPPPPPRTLKREVVRGDDGRIAYVIDSEVA